MSRGVLKYTVVRRHPNTLSAVALPKGSEVPDWASDLVDDDDLETKAAAKKAAAQEPTTESPQEPTSDSTENAGGYADQTVKKLKAEVDTRNEGRDDDDKIVVGGNGNKPDLVAALEADDNK